MRGARINERNPVFKPARACGASDDELASMSMVAVQVIIPRAIRMFLKMLNLTAHDRKYHKSLVKAGLIERWQTVDYETRAVINNSNQTYWKVFTRDLDDRVKDHVFIYQSKAGPNAEYTMAYHTLEDDNRDAKMEDVDAKMQFYGPIRDMTELIETVDEFLLDGNIEYEIDFDPIIKALQDDKYWDALAQIKNPQDETREPREKHMCKAYVYSNQI